MNGFSAAVASSSPPIPPPNPTLETDTQSTRLEYSTFKFKNIGQPPTLLARFSDVGAASDYRSPSPEQSDMDTAPSEDPTMMVVEDNRTSHPFRATLLDRLGRSVDHPVHDLKVVITQTQDPGAPEPVAISPLSASLSNLVLPRPETRLTPVSRQLSAAVDAFRTDALPRASIAPETHAYALPDSNTIDIYADPDTPSRSPLSLFSDLSQAVRESAELDRITSLHHQLTAEREELLARHEETTRALSRTKTQLDRVLLLTDEAIQMTTVFVDKEKTRLDTKKTKAEAEIERRKNLEAEHRKAKELERTRQHEEERKKAQVEMEQQAERQRLEEQRKKEEALAAEKRRQEEIQAREREERCRRLEEEERQRERQRLEDQQREEDRKRQAEEQQRKEKEEREAFARKQEEDKRTQLIERQRLAEEERRKEVEAAAKAEVEAKKQAADKEQQRLFQERRATVLKDKYKNYHRPESGVPSTGSSSTVEGPPGSSLPSIVVNDASTNIQAVGDRYPGLAKIHGARYAPAFVPATTEAGRLPPDLSQRVKVSEGLVDHTVKHEATSPVITPVDNDQPMEDTLPTQLPSRPVSSMSTSAPASAPTPLPAPSHLPAKPVTIYSRPPVPLQQRGRSPHRYLSRPSRSGSRSSSRSPRTSRSPDTARGRYPSPRRGDHYSPPRQSYRDGGSRYDHDSRSHSPPPPPNPRKRTLHEDPWQSASTPSKLDYSNPHPAKRRVASPPRSRSTPSPPPVAHGRRQPTSGRRGRGGGPQKSLEQRISRQPQLSERIR